MAPTAENYVANADISRSNVIVFDITKDELYRVSTFTDNPRYQGRLKSFGGPRLMFHYRWPAICVKVLNLKVKPSEQNFFEPFYVKNYLFSDFFSLLAFYF